MSIRTTPALAALGAALALAACGGGSSSSPSIFAPAVVLQAAYTLGPVDGGTCTLTAPGIASPIASATTRAGLAQFTGALNLPSQVLISCQGGTYADEATGSTLTAPLLRAYASPTAQLGTYSVTPLTEIAVRRLGAQSPATAYAKLSQQVAGALGLGGISLETVTPQPLTAAVLSDTPAGRYGAALAALSQAQVRGQLGKTVDAVIARLAANLDANGKPVDETVSDQYATALADLPGVSRLSGQLASAASMAVLQNLYDRVVSTQPLAVVKYVNTDFSLTRTALSSAVVAGAPSVIHIVGQHFGPQLSATLGGAACTLRDLESMSEADHASTDEGIYANCPAVPVGSPVLTVFDDGVQVAQITLSSAPAPAPSPVIAPRAAPATGNGPANLSGQVTADAPTIDNKTGAHNYAQLRNFAVKGVTVELIDQEAGGTVLLQSSTDQNGAYRFLGAPAGRKLAVVVKAQLSVNRAPGSNSGPSWNFTVKDNTSPTLALYTVNSPTLTLAAGDNTQNINAPVGFTPAGDVDPTSVRASAPFSILEVINTAAQRISAADPNASMPAVNIYWSAANTTTDGNKKLGSISTSHYSDSGDLPGVFILGKANVDTDEFDQGVIGHEFGHYLQQQLSYSDNPGGAHAQAEFKDASLAYGEGYGTAIGGLLSGSPFYIDTKGDKQGSGGVTDLNSATKDGVRKGFYSEESVGYVMYQMGVRYGFSPLWRAVSALRSGHQSSTVFSFLAQYQAINPGADLSALLGSENIRTTDSLGTLPAGTPADPAINATASKGANDLETLYIPVALIPNSADGSKVSVDGPGFCFNRNLTGANDSNGLGMLKRFTFTADYTGTLGVQLVNDQGQTLSSNDYSLSARSSKGANASIYVWDKGLGRIAVEAGVTYTVRLSVDKPSTLPNGNRCGHQMQLWRA